MVLPLLPPFIRKKLKKISKMFAGKKIDPVLNSAQG